MICVTSVLVIHLFRIISEAPCPQRTLVLFTCRWCVLNVWSWSIWCDISPPHRSRVGPGHTVFLFAAAHADNLPGMEACHKDLAQGVWENSSGVFQAQTPALMTSNKYEHLFLWKRCIRLFAWPSVSFGFGCGFSLPNSQQCCLESCLRISWIIRLTRSL